MVARKALTLPPMTHSADVYKAPNLDGRNESMSSFINYSNITPGGYLNASPYDRNPHMGSSRRIKNHQCLVANEVFVDEEDVDAEGEEE